MTGASTELDICIDISVIFYRREYCVRCHAQLFGTRRARSVGPSSAASTRPGPGEAACVGCGYTVFRAEMVSR